ncbi:hypothetical protein DYU11_09825 [Fibrisoma montanum]|uniref:DNA repair protein n=1 Tax=Fibrisoma montanum TaxID=2305895 RepID=A0A418MFS0_9BACT|nr:CRISPR-associated endonuclease Cas6 [Fibrisoma montanum]RIV25642.1 hypothetical protein DYU11_09825 [Fibrisoma montanum]
MKRIRYLTVRFDTDIEQIEIPAFRGAVIEKVGREYDLFHNHADGTGFVYRYPFIQYKRIGRNPAIICVDEGVDAIHHFFQNQTWHIRLGNRPLELRIRDLRLNQYTLQAWEHTFRFQIRDWLALNEANYARFQHTSDEIDRIELLERVLTGNILSMAKGLDWHIDRKVRVRISAVSPPRLQRFKDQLLTSFDVEFATNVFLPDWIGLGKGVSVGFGVVKQKSKGEGRMEKRDERETPTTQHDDEY